MQSFTLMFLRLSLLLRLNLIGFGLSLITFGLFATPGAPLASFDPHHPATLLSIADSRLREFRSAVSELLRDLVDEFTAPYRERLRRESPTPSQPQ